MKCKVNLELLNQAGDHNHVVASKDMMWTKDERGSVEVSIAFMECNIPIWR